MLYIVKYFSWHSYTIRMLSYVICMPFLCRSYVLVVYCSCHSHVLVCLPYVTHMYLYGIRKSLVCTQMSSVCHSYVLVCHLYVTHMYSLSSVSHSFVVLPWIICLLSSRISNIFEHMVRKFNQCNLLIYINENVQLSRLIDNITNLRHYTTWKHNSAS